MNKSTFTHEELEALPTLRPSEIAQGMYADNDFIYDSIKTRKVIAKATYFKFQKNKNYYKFDQNKNWGDEEFPDLEPWSLKKWDEIAKIIFPKDMWWANDLIPKFALVVIAAVAGERKTWLAMHIAKCIASGTHLFGNERYPVKKGKVLYLDAEMSVQEMQRRGNKLRFNEIPSDQILIMTGQDVNLKTSEGWENFVDIIRDNNIDVVFIDTLRGVAGGLLEDKAEEVRGFMKRFNTLKNEGVSVVILDHCRKPSHFDGYLPKKEQLLGSQDKVANAELVLMLRSENYTSSFLVAQVKNRIDTLIKPFNITMKDNVDGTIDFQYEGLYDEQTSKMDRAMVLIPQIIGTGALTTKQVVEMMQKQHDVSKRYTEDTLRELTRKEILIRQKNGRQFEYKNTKHGLLIPQIDQTLGIAEIK